jgi:hypothetical protein
LRELFNLFDLDRSGAITVDEIKKRLGGDDTYFRNSKSKTFGKKNNKEI